MKLAVWTLPAASPGAAAQQVRRAPSPPQWGRVILPAGPQPVAPPECGETLWMRRCPRNVQGCTNPALQNPADNLGQLPQDHACPFWQQGAKSRVVPGSFSTAGPFPLLGQCLLSFEVPLNKGIDDCWSTQPETKDVWSPSASHPCTRDRELLENPGRCQHPSRGSGTGRAMQQPHLLGPGFGIRFRSMKKRWLLTQQVPAARPVGRAGHRGGVRAPVAPRVPRGWPLRLWILTGRAGTHRLGPGLGALWAPSAWDAGPQGSRERWQRSTGSPAGVSAVAVPAAPGGRAVPGSGDRHPGRGLQQHRAPLVAFSPTQSLLNPHPPSRCFPRPSGLASGHLFFRNAGRVWRWMAGKGSAG